MKKIVLFACSATSLSVFHLIEWHMVPYQKSYLKLCCCTILLALISMKMGRPLIMLKCLTILRNQTNWFPKYGQKWPSMVVNLVTYGWVHPMRARHTTVLLTQKLVQIGQKLILLFQLLLANYKMHWPGVLSANVYQCAGYSLWKIPVNIFGSLWWFISYLTK